MRCILTSRRGDFDDLAKVTSLDQWSDQVTAEYLLARTGRDDAAGAARLAHALGGLPLAAEQAAAFLKFRKGISFDDYADKIARLIKDKPTGDYPDTVYAAFVKSLDALGETEAGKISLDILRLCAFLSPDGVDLWLLTVERGNQVLPASFAAAMADKFKREDAPVALGQLSLLRQEDGPMRLRNGDISDLLPVIAQIETEHRAWVAEDPDKRNFGPPSFFEPQNDKHRDRLLSIFATAGGDADGLKRRLQSRELSRDDFAKIVAEQIAHKDE